MGKLSEAIEKRRKESAITAERMPLRQAPLEPEPPQKTPERPLPPAHGEFNAKLVVLTAPDSVDAENFKILRAQVLFRKNGDRPRCIMVTSALPGEGKSFVAANLAVSIAMGINEYVLLVDCDLRRPSMHQLLGYSNSRGLHEYLVGKAALEDLIIRTRIDKLSILPAGALAHNPSELLSSARMRDFIQEVKNRYQDRYVIIDATPSQVTAEASVLSQNVDGVIFVVRAQKAPKDIIKRSVDNLGKNKILGVVFNGYEGSYRHYTRYYKKYYKDYYAKQSA